MARRKHLPKQRQEIEMVDGRKYFSEDGWATVWRQLRGTSRRAVLDKHEADTVRFLVAMGAAHG